MLTKTGRNRRALLSQKAPVLIGIVLRFNARHSVR